jgi:UDP-3-O-[3-hydroxymyristoyl] glucosamine N-acyltransferase
VEAAVGADVVIPEPARLGPLRLALMRLAARGRLRVEGRVTLGRGARIEVARDASVVLGDGVHLGAGARVEAAAGAVGIGARTLVGDRVFVVGLAGVEIGRDCVLGDFAAVGVAAGPGAPRATRLGDRVRLGAHAVVEAGAQIAPGSVVGSYALVNCTPDA